MKKIGVFLKKKFFLNQYLGDLINRLLVSNDVEIYFFHFNGLSVDTKEVELPESIHSFDLTAKSLKEFGQFTQLLGLDLFVFSSFRNLFDYSVQCVVKEQNIKTVYIEHGLPVIAPYKYNFKLLKRYLKSYSIIVLKNLQMVLNFRVKYLKFLVATLIGFRKSSSFFLFDYGILYSDYSRKKYFNWFNNSFTKIFYSGFPLFSDKEERARLDRLAKNKSQSVLYIHQPLVEDTLINLSFQEFCKSLLAVAEVVENAGYNFIIKLHPRSCSNHYNEILGAYIDNGDLTLGELIVCSEQVIGHFSSALAIALFFNKKSIKLHLPEFRVKGDEIFDEFCLLTSSLVELEYNLHKDGVFNGPDSIQSIIGTNNTHFDRYQTFLEVLFNADGSDQS